VEQGDWAGATSSVSSKLIPRGLRYLETYDFKLVRKRWQSGRCCWQWLRIASGRCVSGCRYTRTAVSAALQLTAGLTLYDLLAGLPGPQMAHRHFNHESFAQRFSFLVSE